MAGLRSATNKGGLLVRGNYEHGLPTGTWSIFHSNGRRALRGSAIQGSRSGIWKAHSAVGNGSSSVRFDAQPMGITNLGQSWEVWTSEREKSGELRDKQGNLLRGQFVDDLRDGEWITTNADGNVVRQVTYRSGERHGRSVEIDHQLGSAKSPTIRETYYLHGHPVPSLSKLLLRLEQDLNADHGGRQFEALRTIVELGVPAEKLLTQVLDGSDTHQQTIALQLLAEEKHASDMVLRKIERLTKSAEQKVSIEAWFTMYQLAPQRRNELARELIQLAARSELPVRYSVEYRLGQEVGPLAEVVVRELESEDPTVRRVAVEVLAVMLSVGRWTDESATAEREVALTELLAKVRGHKDPAIAAAAGQLERRRGAVQ